MATNVIGTTVYNGHTYHILTSDELGSTAEDRWENAKIHCANLGGHLAIIDDANENSALFSYLQSIGVNNAYFGLSDAAQEGTWTWVDGTPLTYSNWGTGEPSNLAYDGTAENYGMFYVDTYSNGEWNDGDFRETVSFICEVDSVDTSGLTVNENAQPVQFYIDSATELLASLGIATYDFVFLFDISGSMSSYITRVKDIVGNFAARLQSSGITNYRFAVGEYGDLDEIYAYPFANGSYFTNDINEFTTAAAQAADKASNGGADEYGLTALHDAIYGISFNPLAQKRFIVLTDEGYEENNRSTLADGAVDLNTVLGELGATGIVVDVIGYPDDDCQGEWEPLAKVTGGKFYDIRGDYNSIFQYITNEVTGQGDTPIVNDTLMGRIMFAQWGYGFTPPEGNPLYNPLTAAATETTASTITTDLLATSADLVADFGSPTLDEIAPVNFAVTPDDFAALNFNAVFAIKQANKILAASKANFR